MFFKGKNEEKGSKYSKRSLNNGGGGGGGGGGEMKKIVKNIAKESLSAHYEYNTGENLQNYQY